MKIQGLNSSSCAETCRAFTQITELSPCVKLGNAILQVTISHSFPKTKACTVLR